jgi:hypothetical protein
MGHWKSAKLSPNGPSAGLALTAWASRDPKSLGHCADCLPLLVRDLGFRFERLARHRLRQALAVEAEAVADTERKGTLFLRHGPPHFGPTGQPKQNAAAVKNLGLHVSSLCCVFVFVGQPNPVTVTAEVAIAHHVANGVARDPMVHRILSVSHHTTHGGYAKVVNCVLHQHDIVLGISSLG